MKIFLHIPIKFELEELIKKKNLFVCDSQEQLINSLKVWLVNGRKTI
jgi:hypothetical protein